MNRKQICGHGSFIFLCTLLFAYQVYHCIEDFLNQTPIPFTKVENQELHPLPSICISQTGILKRKITRHNIRPEDYFILGKWKSSLPEYDETETYNDISASFEDLIHSVTISKEIDDVSQTYIKEKISSTNKSLPIGRCDYHNTLKCYCIHLSNIDNTFGIQQVVLKTTNYSIFKFSIVPQNRFYDHLQKFTSIKTEAGFLYANIVEYSLSNHLPTKPDGCSTEMNWRTDDCKLKFIHDQIYSRLNCTTPWLQYLSR